MKHNNRPIALSVTSLVPALCIWLCAGTIAGADVTPSGAMLRFPDISATQVCFVYANNIWVAPREGGTALPVATPPGAESFPRFSPDGKTIAFVGNYDGNRDIYTIPVAGGIPTRITHHPAGETLCDWTPDGKLLYMSNGFAGLQRQSQLFTVSASGGNPEKLPMPYSGFGSLSEPLADGQWAAFTLHSTDTRTWKRYRGGMATDVWLLNLKTNQSKQITDWEGTDTLPMWGSGADKGTVYFISDDGPEHRLNIQSYQLENGKKERLTSFKDDDVRWPSIGPGDKGQGEIIFQLGSTVRVIDLTTRAVREIKITIPGDRPTIRPRLEDAAKNVTSFDLSPTAKRVIVEARGDLWSIPASEGTARNLTRTEDQFERDPSWSPDGKWIAYLSDASGEYELWLRASDAKAPEPKKEDGKDEAPKNDGKKDEAKKADAPADDKPAAAAGPKVQPTKLTTLGPGFRYGPTWSPDSKLIALTDKAGAILLATLSWTEADGAAPAASATVKVIDTDPHDNRSNIVWSADSSWLAYTLSDSGNTNSCIWLYNVKSGEKTRVTSPMFSTGNPAFDPKGDWLFATTNRNFNSPQYADLDTTFVYAGTEMLMMFPLRDDVKDPFAPKSDEEEIKADAKADKKGDAKKEESKKDEPKKEEGKKDDSKKDEAKPDDAKGKDSTDKPKDDKPKDEKKDLKIDLDGFERRGIALPVPPGNFGGLAVTHDGKLIYGRATSRGVPGEPSIKIFDLKDDAKEEKTVVSGTAGFGLSADGKKIIIRKGDSFVIHDAAAGGGKPQPVSTAGMRVLVEPRKEWKQIITDTYRLQRDFFYESKMHNVDWDKVRDHYMAMIDDCGSREDVAWVQSEMVSELNIGHAYITSPGDVEKGPAPVGVGLLGCDFVLETTPAGTAYKIATILEGGPWDLDAKGPLSQPGPKASRAVAGDYLLAVNGVPVDTMQDVYAAFVGLVDRPVTITVSSKPVMDGTQRDVLVKPIGSEVNLRYRAWIERNRQIVDKASGGKVGYIYVPNTGVDGQNDLFRQFAGQRDRAGLIIDERWNGGGQIPTRFIELLNRPVTNYWAKRDGKDWTWPPDATQAHMCMLINGLAGSGGDMFPWLFKHNNIGKVIGMRTWGGLVGISGNPGLIDGGSISVPTFGFYKTDGTWGVEGHGVDPDIKVVDDPGLMLAGGDPQLEAGIKLMLDEIAKKPYQPPARPAGPDRRGMGIPEKDR